MTDPISVKCLVDRYWDAADQDYKTYRSGWESGELIDCLTQSSDDDPARLVPVGIVFLDDGTFHSVPMEFIKDQYS